MGKIITAKDLLKEKGFVPNKFDTTGFMNAVAGYFSERDVNSRLVVLRTRFVDIKTGEEVERMKKDGEYGWDRHEYLNLSDEDRERGWKTMNIDLDEWIKYSIRNYGAEGFSDYASEIKKRTLYSSTYIIVDNPFYENSLSMLRIMGGYVVEKKRGKLSGTASVSLI